MATMIDPIYQSLCHCCRMFFDSHHQAPDYRTWLPCHGEMVASRSHKSCVICRCKFVLGGIVMSSLRIVVAVCRCNAGRQCCNFRCCFGGTFHILWADSRSAPHCEPKNHLYLQVVLVRLSIDGEQVISRREQVINRRHLTAELEPRYAKRP